LKLQTSSLGRINVEFITSVNYDKIGQLNREFFKDRPKYRPIDTIMMEEEFKKVEPPTQKPPTVNPPFNHFLQPPLPFDSLPPKKEDERKGPSALERALMESSQENQESSTLEKLVQEKVYRYKILYNVLVPI